MGDVAAPHAVRTVGVIAYDRASGYVGVGVRVVAADVFELTLIHLERARTVTVGRFDEFDVVAAWRSFGAASGLPLLLERPDGALDAPYPQIGRLQLGAIRIRRRHSLLAGRRPRFLARRKVGRLPKIPTVWRGREMLGKEPG